MGQRRGRNRWGWGGDRCKVGGVVVLMVVEGVTGVVEVVLGVAGVATEQAAKTGARYRASVFRVFGACFHQV